MDCNDGSKRKISRDVYRGSRNRRTAATAFAEIDQDLIETADEAVHIVEPEEGEQVSDADVAFHQALCLVGISTEALDELGGCEALPPIGGDD